MTSKFTIDWYLTQAFGQYCGYTKQISFLKDSDYKKKDCLLKVEMSNCDLNNDQYKLFSVNVTIDKFINAFGNSAKVVPYFVYIQPNGQKAISTNISTLAFTASLASDGITCTLANYPLRIRAILSVADQTIDTIRLMIYIGSVS